MPNKKQPKTFFQQHFAEVTTFSKAVAIALFITLPFMGFVFGTWYGRLSTTSIIVETSPSNPQAQVQACTEEAKICPDGSYVGRTGSMCEFAPCPTQ